MRRLEWMRLLPLLAAAALAWLLAAIWPGASGGVLAWINAVLLIVLIVLLGQYGFRLLLLKGTPEAGSRLRARLVIGLVGMLLVPAMALQIAASQMVERGMDVWFDVRVDTLLDRALNLARGFYARVEKDLKRGMLPWMSDPVLLAAVQGRADYAAVAAHLTDIQTHEGWDRVQLFDLNERLVAAVRQGALGGFKARPLNEPARLAMRLGRMATELRVDAEGEYAVGYAPLVGATSVVGLMRVEVRLPEGVIRNARAVEADYRTYRDLERNRRMIRDVFAHAMLFITIWVVIIAGFFGVWFARRLTAPVADLAGALRRVTEGELDVEIPEAPDDELGSLVRSFNRMVVRLRENAQAIEQARQDLTEALASSRQRQHVLESLLANLQSGVLLVERDGRIRLLNQSLRQILRLPDAWSPGAMLPALAAGHLRPLAEFFDEIRHQAGGALQREYELDHGGRRRVHVLIRGARLETADARGFAGYLLVVDDITALVEAQRSKAWAEVAQRLAHEIKNPLTPIRLAADRLRRRFRDQVDDVGVFDACTEAVITQVDRLQRLIADFSTLARLPGPKLQELDATQLLEEMRALYGSIPRMDVRPFAAPAPCRCDPDQVRQVLINLIENALAATEPRGMPVRLYLTRETGFVCWHVEDDGPGIPEADADTIFEPYFSTREDGTGLGLAIAQRIAEDHGGELLLLSRRAPTHFCLRLPERGTSMEEP
ncbi:MAG: ATP-binding protein [Mariprofundaceae bacterium]